MSDLFGAMLMQGVNDLPIHQEDVQKLSLQFVCLRNDFEFEVKQIIASTIYTVINKYFSPRVMLKLFDDLDKDWAATVARCRNDRFAQFAIETIQAEIAKSNMSTKTVIDEHRAALREVIGRGNPATRRARFFSRASWRSHASRVAISFCRRVKSGPAGRGIRPYMSLPAECASYCAVAAIGCLISAALRGADSTSLTYGGVG
jgi:hypothetical protein